MSNENSHQTYLKDCNCDNGGVIIHEEIPVCRWCRVPYAKGCSIFYLPEHFKASNIDVKEKERDWEICECYYGDIQNVHSYIPEDKEDSCIKRKCSIYSVRRLSDNSVWAVGDSHSGYTITHFKIKDGDMYAHFAPSAENNLLLSQLKAPIQETPKPLLPMILFTTEDGVPLYNRNDVVIGIRKKDLTIASGKGDGIGTWLNGWYTTYLIRNPKENDQEVLDELKKEFVIFRSQEKANEYILMNKPCLSFREVERTLNEVNSGAFSANDLLRRSTSRLLAIVENEFAKEKIK